MVNPDGLLYDLERATPTAAGARTASRTAAASRVGTDLNRNYGYVWHRATANQASEQLPRPATVLGARDTRHPRLRAQPRVGGRQRIRTHITFHTAGELVLWPYGYTYTDVPAGHDAPGRADLRGDGPAHGRQQRLPARAVERPVHHRRRPDRLDVRARSASSRFTFEMYPAGDRHQTGCYPPDELIGRETERNREAVLYLMELADCPYRAIGTSAARYCGPLLRRPRDRPRLAGAIPAARTRPARERGRGGSRRGRHLPAGQGRVGPGGAGHRAFTGVDVDGGRTTDPLAGVSGCPTVPGDPAAALLGRAIGAAATAADRFRVLLVDRRRRARRWPRHLEVGGDRRAPRAGWRSLAFAIPGELRGRRVAVQLVAVDAGRDATVEAGVDDVRIDRRRR